LKIRDRLKRVRLVIFDVDGVLTEGGITLSEDGKELKTFDSKDGAGIKYLIRSGIDVAFLSGRSSPAVERRAKELGVGEVITGAKNKLPAFERLLKKKKIREEDVCFVGDDLPDLPVLKRAGLAATVPEAPYEVRRACHLVLSRGGGKGAAREIAEKVLKAQGKWRNVLRRYL